MILGSGKNLLAPQVMSCEGRMFSNVCTEMVLHLLQILNH